MALAERIRAMSDEEYDEFKQKQPKFRGFEDKAGTKSHLQTTETKKFIKRSNRILLSLMAAVGTFGSLYAITGYVPGFSHQNRFYNSEGSRCWCQERAHGHFNRPTHRQMPSNYASADGQ